MVSGKEMLKRLLYAGGCVLAGCAQSFAQSPPVLEVNTQQFVNEGETLEFLVRVTDPDGDPISVSAGGVPTTATFTDLGDGVFAFSWTPEFVGPLSAAASPFVVTFHATDGGWLKSKAVEIWVGNVNRPPQFVPSAPAAVKARDTLRITISAVDPDADPLTFYCLSEIDGTTILGENPWTCLWATSDADVGQTTLKFVCADDYGAADTVAVLVSVAESAAQSLGITQSAGQGGDMAEVEVCLYTRDSIGGVDLLIGYNPTALSFDGVDRAGGGTENWEYFSVSEIEEGSDKSIHVTGIADMVGGIPVSALPPSDTVLFKMRFILTNRAQFFGQSIPLTFNLASGTDNVLSDQNGVLIPQEQIEYTSGAIAIQEPEGFLIGDINLNGTAFEIGDAVRFANYFIHGLAAALSPVQMANSDCNQDGIMGTVADLVYLIRFLAD